MNSPTKRRLVVGAILVSVLSFAVRLLTLELPELGLDAIRQWTNVKHLTLYPSDIPWRWNHHTARFGIIAPTWLVQTILGTGALVYYATPMLFAALQSVLAFLLGRALHSERVGFLAAIVVTLLPSMVRDGSQLLPAVFSGVYTTAAYLFLVLGLRRQEKGLGWAVLAAVAMFLAYGSKVQALFSLPGLALAVSLYAKQRWRMLAAFVGTLFGFYLIETSLYALLTDFKYGQLQIITTTYGKSGKLEAMGVANLLGLFRRYAELGTATQVALGLYAVTAVAMTTRWRRLDTGFKLVLLGSCSFLFFMTFAIKSLSPIVPLTLFMERYMTEIVPVAVVIAACGLGMLASSPIKLTRYAAIAAAAAFVAFTSLGEATTPAILLGLACAAALLPWRAIGDRPVNLTATFVLLVGAVGFTWAQYPLRWDERSFAVLGRFARIAAEAHANKWPVIAPTNARRGLKGYTLVVDAEAVEDYRSLPAVRSVSFRGRSMLALQYAGAPVVKRVEDMTSATAYVQVTYLRDMDVKLIPIDR